MSPNSPYIPPHSSGWHDNAQRQGGSPGCQYQLHSAQGAVRQLRAAAEHTSLHRERLCEWRLTCVCLHKSFKWLYMCHRPLHNYISAPAMWPSGIPRHLHLTNALYKQCLLFGKRLILQNLDSCNSVSPSRFVLWHSRITLHLHLTNALYKQWLLFEKKNYITNIHV